MRKIEQTWWHIEDQIKPSTGRIIRQVMDIYTDQQFFRVPLGDFYFVKLHVYNKTNRNELVYSESQEEEDKIIVNLGSLKSWPKSYLFKYKVKHVKLEIEYTLLEPKFERSTSDFFSKGILYSGAFSINELIQPEFYITLPRGLRLKGKGKSSKILLFINFENKTLKNIIDESGLKRVFNTEYISGYEINYEGPYIQKNDKKEGYSYLITNDDYKILKKFNDQLKIDHELFFLFNYEVTYDWKLFGTLFGLGLSILFLVILRVMYLLNNGGDGTFTVSFIIVFVSYIALLLKYHDDEYNLPIIPMITISIIFFVIWVICEYLLYIPHHTVHIIQDFSNLIINIKNYFLMLFQITQLKIF